MIGTLAAAVPVLVAAGPSADPSGTPQLFDVLDGRINGIASTILAWALWTGAFFFLTWIIYTGVRLLVRGPGRTRSRGTGEILRPAVLSERIRSGEDPQREATGTKDAPVSPMSRTWTYACAIRDEVRAAQAEWEFDLDEQLFRRPLLAELTEPLTAAWIDALAHMDAVFPDSEPRSTAVADRCLAAATDARLAWRAADAHARKVGLGELSSEDRRALDTARKLLTAAADPGTTEEERRTQVARVIDILVATTSRPKTAVAEQVQTRLNVKLRQLGLPPLRTALTERKEDR